MSETTCIITCTCFNDFQDKTYGYKKRVANVKKNPQLCTCTVCGKQHSTKFVAPVVEEKKGK